MVCGEKSFVDAVYDDVADIVPGKEGVRSRLRFFVCGRCLLS
jgi:hypothetical protein